MLGCAFLICNCRGQTLLLQTSTVIPSTCRVCVIFRRRRCPRLGVRLVAGRRYTASPGDPLAPVQPAARCNTPFEAFLHSESAPEFRLAEVERSNTIVSSETFFPFSVSHSHSTLRCVSAAFSWIPISLRAFSVFSPCAAPFFKIRALSCLPSQLRPFTPHFYSFTMTLQAIRPSVVRNLRTAATARQFSVQSALRREIRDAYILRDRKSVV